MLGCHQPMTISNADNKTFTEAIASILTFDNTPGSPNHPIDKGAVADCLRLIWQRLGGEVRPTWHEEYNPSDRTNFEKRWSSKPGSTANPDTNPADYYLDNERKALVAENEHLKTMHTEKRVAAAPPTYAVRLSDAMAEVMQLQADLASVTEQRDVLKRQLEELRAEMRNPAVPQPKQVEPGGPIWVRVVDTTSKHFGLVGRLEGIEFDSKYGDEMWSVDMGGIANVWRANVFAVVGTGRQGVPDKSAPCDRGILSQTLDQKAKSFHENNPPDTEHQQAQNRDQWRATCLANGAKDCTVYFGPGDEVTFVVEMNQNTRKTISEIKEALMVEHCLPPTSYKLREVRPVFSGPNKGRD